MSGRSDCWKTSRKSWAKKKRDVTSHAALFSRRGRFAAGIPHTKTIGVADSMPSAFQRKGASMRLPILIAVVLLLAASARPCDAQFVRPPVVVFRPPVIHVPVPHVHVPQGTNQRGGSDGVSSETLIAIVGVIGVLAALGGGAYLIYAWRKKSMPRARIRIIGLPPGEAPEWVRWAWLGLELPLIQSQVRSEKVAAEQVLSHRPAETPPAYAVDGRAAIEILASASPEAAAWWRQWAPVVLAPGYQLVFPAANCERLDDLGA
jgi:hypothetical protein